MAKKLSFKELYENMNFYIQEALNNKIFVYPTDTIYWIWAIQTPKNIVKIAHIKQRDPKQMMSIIAPNFERIMKKVNKRIEKLYVFHDKTNDDIMRLLKEYLNKYHWVTYIFDYNISWMRIIKHPFQDFIQKLWKPFITTSLNISGTQVVNNLKLMPKEIESQVDYIIDDGVLSWRSSVLIDFVSDKIIER